ncbi:hypothetical protein [Alienimonas sp. DA493]|uniref:hypothetical protein n=1 Tax=Alienimonas sp. DA493 TaxID=3373605 RepID=UPI003754B1A1
MSPAAAPPAPAARPWGDGRTGCGAVAVLLLAVGAAIAADGYRRGAGWQAAQDADRARVAVEWARPGRYRTPLHLTERDSAATLVAVENSRRGPFAGAEEKRAEAARTAAALTGLSGTWTIRGESGEFVFSSPLRPYAGGFLARGLPVGEIPPSVLAGTYTLEIDVTRPAAEDGAGDLFVYDRQYEFPVLRAIWQTLFGAAIAVVGVLALIAVLLSVWWAGRRSKARGGGRGEEPPGVGRAGAG